ncbi:MAG: metal ABC transporter ATP-binding protein [Dermatophilaceae bacterium]
MSDPATVLSLRGACFGYADRAVVGELTLTVRAGEVLALLGPNGAGKSTVVKGILGLATQFGGEVELFGTPRHEADEPGRVGYVPQRHTLASGVPATVWEVVSSGRLPRRPWLRRTSAHDREVVRRSIDLVGLADRARTDVGTLSGGQQRRVLIARALAGEPEILVMDEPTAGVDAAAQQVLAAVLGRLAATGVTMVIVTHELAALAALVTRVVVVDQGSVVFDGSPAAFAQATGARPDPEGHHHPGRAGAAPTWVAAVAGPLPLATPRGSDD